ncbi:hypothetical protein Tco_1204157 [Tanacetum coccineum]
MTSWNQRITGQIHTPQRIKFLRRTSFKGRHMILGRSSNGSADEQERRKLCKADLASNPEGHQILRNIYEPLPLGGPPGQGMETRKWSEDDKRRSKDFITAIEKRLQIRRIFRSLESFVGGRIRDVDYRLINRTT